MAKVVVSLSFDTLADAASIVEALKEDRLVVLNAGNVVGYYPVKAEVLRSYEGWTY